MGLAQSRRNLVEQRDEGKSSLFEIFRECIARRFVGTSDGSIASRQFS
jgi:hypothetical protein